MFGFIFIAVSWVVVVITPFVTCRPLSGYWTIDPYPTSKEFFSLACAPHEN